MKSVPFLKIDNQTLTLKQVVRLSQSSGGWQSWPCQDKSVTRKLER
ncbi:MAG: hypothetical protein WBG70_18275 [Spirulinaceae cyanobacterium]